MVAAGGGGGLWWWWLVVVVVVVISPTVHSALASLQSHIFTHEICHPMSSRCTIQPRTKTGTSFCHSLWVQGDRPELEGDQP